MAPTPSSNGATTSVQVALRIRPPTTQDSISIPARFQRTVINAISSTSVSVDGTASAPASVGSSTAVSTAASTAASNKKQVFTFDQVHPPSTTQHALFTATTQPLISRFVEGFNCTILAYGQTSSGKTFSMTGIDLDGDPMDPTNGIGIIPRAVSTIFSRCREVKEEKGNSWNFSIKGSFIEIYNEDLIDLLSMDEGGGRREVQIREDKQGHIFWEGLREVSVRNASEVMSLIRQGTAIRRTNETDMNAQSSRSHAIFSLTLIQKKFSGSSPPPRSSSPLPPGGRSPSRIARPGSLLSQPAGRVSSPTFGRPPTPSFHSAIARGGTRPASSLGLLTANGGRGQNLADADDDQGEWVTVVSKFHFVDLAGSERLKRTAAAGERIKEGISINSGLLALGNVISALGDPSRAKSHTASYIPYRDSKLTRLLQDSLGGNAHTLMIACVSPAEWNAGETLNTLKYANRARNIKNRAVVNEKEEGWDDIEWLQGMVTRLRKEVKQIKDGGGISSTPRSGDTPEAAVEGAGKRVLDQMAELQNNYEDLRSKFVERTEELTRLRRELGEKQRTQKSGNVGGTAKYEEIVGPVIEEYEKTISAMEAELSLNRAALRHTNDMVEEKEVELSQLVERHATTEMYVEELRSRVAKLTEREASTEAYVRDLEEKVKLYDESSITSSGSISDLKREITKYKDNEAYSTQYIADLEARLGRADESVLSLREAVERLEKESERRREEVVTLQSQLDSLTQDGQNWRSDLEGREKKVRALELKIEEWEAKRKEAGEDRERLGELADEVARVRKDLETGSPTKSNGFSHTPSEASSINEPENLIESQFVALQQTHTATLADLSTVSAKYRDALREIADLAAQLQEAKMTAPTPHSELSELSESPERSTSEAPSPRRRLVRGPSRDALDVQLTNAGSRRLLFRQAASSESLHARSLSQSLSLSQELSSARSRKTSGSSHGTSSSVSYSPSHNRPNLSISMSSINVNANERSVQSLEKEIMRLQEVLKERETEITSLETTLKEQEGRGRSGNRTPSSASPGTPINGDPALHLSPKTMSQFQALRRSLDLSLYQSGNGAVPENDESLDRLNELMRSMAQKEESHREAVDSMSSELVQVRRQYDELVVLSRDQTLNMSTELEALRNKREENLIELEGVEAREADLMEKLEKAEADFAATMLKLKEEHEEAIKAKGSEVDTLVARLKGEHEGELQSLRDQLVGASTAMDKAHQDHKEAFGKLQADHEEELRRRADEVAQVLEDTKKEHEELLARTSAEFKALLSQKEEESSTILQRTEEEYYEALTKLRSNHALALEKQTAESATVLERLKDQHAQELRMAEIAREGSLTETESARDLAIKELQEAHSAAISKKESLFSGDLQNLKDEHVKVLAAKDEQHRGSVQRLKADHAALLHDKEAAFSETIEKLISDHDRNISTKEASHTAAIEKLHADHEAELQRLKEESVNEVERLRVTLLSNEKELVAAKASHAKDLQEALQNIKEQQAMILQEVSSGHEEEVTKLKAEHQRTIADVEAKAQEALSSLVRTHTEEVARLKAGHQTTIASLQSEVIATQDDHRRDLTNSREEAERSFTGEKARLTRMLAELEEKHAAEKATLLKDHDLLLEEVASYKAASDEFMVTREEARQSHEVALAQKAEIISDLQDRLSDTAQEKDSLNAEVARLRAQLETTRSQTDELVKEASKRRSLVEELEKHRSVIAEMQDNLQRTKDEMDTLQAEKSRQDSILRDLQAQLTRSPSPSSRPTTFARPNGIPPAKLPPLSPPPSIPPPPTPRSIPMHESHSSTTSSTMISGSMRGSDSPLDSPSTPATSVAHSILNGHAPHPPSMATVADLKLMAQVQEQAKHMEEQEAMIKTLNKQLTHCETDLQAHMDLVNSLETSLADSEKNLRKARMQATELARERDGLNSQINILRAELHETKNEVVNVRRSIVEEKQSLEHKLDEERRAKERARAQLDSRMDELQKRKSKFACL